MIKFIKAEVPVGWQSPAAAPSPVAAERRPPARPESPAMPQRAGSETGVPTAAVSAPVAEKRTGPVAFNKEEFKNDPLIKKALEVFKGTIVEVRA
jgi:hypothetical protein